MTTFVTNLNAYLSRMKIKQTYISLKSGIDTKKLSRILTGSQDITGTDMEKIAAALGKRPEYFLAETMFLECGESAMPEFTFCAGEPRGREKRFARLLIELAENADEILSAKGRYMMTFGE